MVCSQLPKVRLVQFGAVSCLPRSAIKEKIHLWLDSRTANDLPVEYQYISLDKEPEIAAAEGIFTVPALKFYVDGKVAVEAAGYFSLEEFFSKVERYLELLK